MVTSYNNRMRSQQAAQLLEEAAARNLRILDVGGGIAPFYRATCVLDNQPFDGERLGRSAWPQPQWTGWTAEQYVKHDICEGRWPLADKSFDLGYAGGIMEDIRDPIFAVREMQRVCKRVIIEQPTRLCEQTRGFEHQAWAGFAHHRWMVYDQDGALVFQRRTPVLNLRRCHHRIWPWQKVRPGDFVFTFVAEPPFEVRDLAFWALDTERDNLTAYVAQTRLPAVQWETNWRQLIFKFRQWLTGAV